MAALLLCGLIFASSAGAQNQAQPSPPAGVHGGNVGHVVADIPRAFAFYRDVLGMSVVIDGTAPWPGDPSLKVADVATVPIPGTQWALELVKLAKPTPAFRPHMQDPGALTLILFVQNLDSILARARAANVPAITTGGTTGVGNARMIKASVLQGPDGEFIELLEPPPPAPGNGAAVPPATPPSGSRVLRGNLRVTVADVNAAARAYEGMLGVQFRGGPAPISDAGVPFMLGQPDATFHLRTTQIPASGMIFELLEIAGPDKATTNAVRSSPGVVYLRVGLAPEKMPAAGMPADPENVFLILDAVHP